MKVMITGANGMVARAAISHCESIGDEVIAFTHADLDISDREKVFRLFEECRPEIVLNCAAYTDVDGSEANEQTAYAANAAGPENLAAASKEFGSEFVTISTDYVFDGTKEGFYTQDDEPDPQSVYAKSKYDGELRATAANDSSIIVRSGWIYGKHGTNFLSVLPDLLKQGRELRTIGDAYGTPTFASDLAVRLRELTGKNASGIFHATNSGPGVSYFEFASDAAALLGRDPQLIKNISQNDLLRPAARPYNSRLKCDRSELFGLAPLRDWRNALAEFLDIVS
ncbi:MAG: dTDP-4-dehydrorhamnose reductase [Acidobacteria bacterium]|nr:MAG: dTDP-4-dehydrorhamnose reductase [Acidobacteriota bacterium]